ncbi:MAG TPA: glycosyltransferase family 9 protein [Chitinophaga sp.]|uniref:glycosyltransferase family 9 protein n=1 Tax=Chitinophaga sp. TaxID=1869181 RepID=UPI002F938C93
MMRKIAVFRALQLGDMLCAIPAIRSLRIAHPKAHITLLGLPWAKDLVQRFNQYFDAFIPFPGFPGLPEQEVDVRQLPAFFTAMQQQEFSLVLQMQGNGCIVNPMAALMGARHTAGFWRKEDYCPDPDHYLEYPDHVPEVIRHLMLMEHLGIKPQGEQLEFPLTPQDQKDLQAAHLKLKYPYVCVHPGSRGAWRQWPPAAFAVVADKIAEMGYQVVLTGTADEQPLVGAVADHMQNPSLNAAGKTNLGAMGVLLKGAAMLLANCTGVAHMADALQTPSVIISMDGEAPRWAALDTELHRTFDWTKEQDIAAVTTAAQSLLAERLGVLPTQPLTRFF